MGAAVPPLESMRVMLPKEHWWPIDDWWNFHVGAHVFGDIHLFADALNARYGAAKSLEDFTLKSQLMAYEGVRAMYEAYGRNKYVSTGVIQWMLNNAWPSIIWHLYDYYLRPGGGYFGVQRPTKRSILFMATMIVPFGWSAADTRRSWPETNHQSRES